MAVPLNKRKGVINYGTYPSNAAYQKAILGTGRSSAPGRTAVGGAGASPMAMKTSTNPQQGWADRYSGPMIDLGGDLGSWGAMIGGDYGVQEAESMMNARMGRARGDFQSQIRSALIDLGIVDKTKLGNLGQYIDQDTIQKAAENKYSQTAKTAQWEAAQRAQSQADLAARGMLGSGQLTTNEENTVAQGESQRYGFLRDFLSGGAQGLTQLADLQDNLSMQVAQARQAAADRAAEAYWRQQQMSQGRIRGVTDSAGRNPGDPGYMPPGLWDPNYQGTNPVGATNANGGPAAGVQDLINQGVLDYEGLKNLGYDPPPWYQG